MHALFLNSRSVHTACYIWLLSCKRSPCIHASVTKKKKKKMVHHGNGDGTNQGKLLCCRVWSESQAVHRARPRLHPYTSWFEFWSPAHRSQSKDSMMTTPPTAHALQIPINSTDTHTNGDEEWQSKGRKRVEHPMAGKRVRERRKREIYEYEHIP